ncbi:unnamed protein product, partial [Meganyctiphanes norvegica]
MAPPGKRHQHWSKGPAKDIWSASGRQCIFSSQNPIAGPEGQPKIDATFHEVCKLRVYYITDWSTLTNVANYLIHSFTRTLYSSGKKCYYTTKTEGFTQKLHLNSFNLDYIRQYLSFIHGHMENITPSQGKKMKHEGIGILKKNKFLYDRIPFTADCVICDFTLGTHPSKRYPTIKKTESDRLFTATSSWIQHTFKYLYSNLRHIFNLMKIKQDIWDKQTQTAGGPGSRGSMWGLLYVQEKGATMHLYKKLKKKILQLLLKVRHNAHSKTEMTREVNSIRNETVAFLVNPAFSEADLARSLLFTVSNDIGQIASLYAMLHGLKRVYFGGYFLRNHPVSMHTISFAIKYWSKGDVQALFLRHEGYIGAIGAFLRGMEEEKTDKYSWGENYAGSSGINSPLPNPQGNGWPGCSIDQFEIDRCDQALTFFPLLTTSQEYVPDTVDLTKDKEARDYWLSCFEGSLDSFVTRAISSQPNSTDSTERANKFRDKYQKRLHHLKGHPFYENPTYELRDQRLNIFFRNQNIDKRTFITKLVLIGLQTTTKFINGFLWTQKKNVLLQRYYTNMVLSWASKQIRNTPSEGTQVQIWCRMDQEACKLWVRRTDGGSRREKTLLEVKGIPASCNLSIFEKPICICTAHKGISNAMDGTEDDMLNYLAVTMMEIQITKIRPILDEQQQDSNGCIRQKGRILPSITLSKLYFSLTATWSCAILTVQRMAVVTTTLNGVCTYENSRLVIKGKREKYPLIISQLCKCDNGRYRAHATFTSASLEVDA